jgi:hypothetical protein
MASTLRPIVWPAVAAAAAGCDFQPDPPEGPAALPGSRTVDVRVEYRQPQGCVNTVSARCVDLVFFFGSWMHPGEEFALDLAPGTYVWSGTAKGVPVNWPPTDQPHLVRVFDPHLQGTPTGGVTGARLIVGGQLLNEFDSPGTPKESALVYIDDDGVGRNPY